MRYNSIITTILTNLCFSTFKTIYVFTLWNCFQPTFGLFAQLDSTNLFLLHCHATMIQYIDYDLSNMSHPPSSVSSSILFLLLYTHNKFSINDTHSSKQQSFQSRTYILLHKHKKIYCFFCFFCSFHMHHKDILLPQMFARKIPYTCHRVITN